MANDYIQKVELDFSDTIHLEPGDRLVFTMERDGDSLTLSVIGYDAKESEYRSLHADVRIKYDK